MEVSAAIIALSLFIGSVGLFLITAIYWFQTWRKKKSGTAHGLFVINIALAIVAALRIVQIVCFMIGGDDGSDQFNLAVGFFVLFVAVAQFALSWGYFNWKE